MGGGRRRRRQVHGKRKGAEAGQPPPPLVVGAEDALVARLALSPHAVREAAGGHRHRLGSRAAADRHRSHPVLHAAHSQPVRGAFGASRCPHQPRGGCQLRVHQRGLPRLAGRRILQAAWRVCGGGGGGHDRPSAHHDRLQLLPLPLRAGHRPPVPARLAVWHLGHRAVPSHALLLARAGSAHLRRRVRNAPSLHAGQGCRHVGLLQPDLLGVHRAHIFNPQRGHRTLRRLLALRRPRPAHHCLLRGLHRRDHRQVARGRDRMRALPAGRDRGGGAAQHREQLPGQYWRRVRLSRVRCRGRMRLRHAVGTWHSMCGTGRTNLTQCRRRGRTCVAWVQGLYSVCFSTFGAVNR
mmetsp:Transcript_5062/g.16741  ORF Transcript_5062/g.16741 Transcript_5062/m.16741 type:complete len:352 (+) Transcript_5062:1012-2067(+)